MSGYIIKSELIDSIVQNVVITTEEGLDLRNEIIELIKNQPIVDEKEIIRKPFERVLERLRQLDYRHLHCMQYKAIEIIKEEGGINE